MSASPLRRALEEELAANPDDLATHAAYADLLGEEGDPRGEYIQVQIALEDPTLSALERDELGKREQELWHSHRAQWLGAIAPHVLPARSIALFEFRRGWLDKLDVGILPLEFARALRDSPEARMLRDLTIESAEHEDIPHEPDDNVPEDDDDHPAFWPLVGSDCLRNLRTFRLGVDQGDDVQGFHCQLITEAVVPLVRSMPRLEELYLFARTNSLTHLFAMATLDNLRVLKAYHNSRVHRLDVLAANPHLHHLTHLLLHPHALAWHDNRHEDEHAGFREEEGYLPLKVVEPLLRGKHLPHLTHLQLRCSSMGDAGVKAIVESGILTRLKSLDLRHGRVTDEGARLLADAPTVRSLERLDLSDNALSGEGVQLLERLGVVCQLERQHRAEDYNYLHEGDYE